MEWSEESLLNLIDIYKAQPVLWSPTDENYFKKNKKADAWRDISSTIGRSDEECRKKIISLLSSYRREKARIKTSTGTGTGKPFILIVIKITKDNFLLKFIYLVGFVDVFNHINTYC